MGRQTSIQNPVISIDGGRVIVRSGIERAKRDATVSRTAFHMPDSKRRLWRTIDVDVHPFSGDDELDVIPAAENESVRLVLRVGIPQHKAVDHRGVLNAVIRGATLGEERM